MKTPQLVVSGRNDGIFLKQPVPRFSRFATLSLDQTSAITSKIIEMFLVPKVYNFLMSVTLRAYCGFKQVSHFSSIKVDYFSSPSKKMSMNV